MLIISSGAASHPKLCYTNILHKGKGEVKNKVVYISSKKAYEDIAVGA